MITLAIGIALYLFAQQNYAIFNGHSGFAGMRAAESCSASTGAIRCRSTISRWRSPAPAISASLYASRSTFGLALQAIRDNPRRMRALGFNVAAHRVAAYAVAGVDRRARRRAARLVRRPHLARHDPRRPADRHPGHRHRRRARATRPGRSSARSSSCCSTTFAIDLVDRDRFNTVIGLAFLADRPVFARRASGPVGESAPHLATPDGRRSNPANVAGHDAGGPSTRLPLQGRNDMKITRRMALRRPRRLAAVLRAIAGAGRRRRIKIGLAGDASKVRSPCSARTASAAPSWR